MIEFARQNSKTNSIEYVLTDLSSAWNLVDHKISKLENQVPLILSNMTIDLIGNRSVFALNLKKLLKRGRRAYFTFPAFPVITKKLHGQDKSFYENFVKLPESDAQTQNWVHIFESIGFEIVHQEVERVVWSLDTRNVLGKCLRGVLSVKQLIHC